ncbi:hypothetical protein HY338_03960 [Candidatus Gottesmanbacteria bacterium]|nr:hypothetical protein [Candidatus Gottesmanbacteria bacterium]
MKRLVGFLVLPLIALAFVFLGALWWGSSCSAIEQGVDDRTLQLRFDGNSWFVFGPPGFSQTAEYLGHLAGLLGKRISSTPDGWEKFKLSGDCGGSIRLAQWAKTKGIELDGKKWPRGVVLSKPPQSGTSGFAWSITIGGLLIAVIMVWLHRRQTFVG